MSAVEVFLDDMPGERRAVIARAGRFERILIEREGDIPQHRLGALSVGRVVEADLGAGGAFVDLGCGSPLGFLPRGGRGRVHVGDRLEVEVTAESRETKGPVLRLLGAGQGEPRLLRAGPDMAQRLEVLAAGVRPTTGVLAIQSIWESEEEALADGGLFPELGLDLAVQRTRAMISVDIDYAGTPGRDPARGRCEANRQGLIHAARLIRLKRWGGLVAVDLVGTGLDGEQVGRWARAAFGADPGVAHGPLSRFGVLQLSLPWTERPLEERLMGAGGRRRLESRALDVVRRLRHHMLSDTTVARFVARCAPEEATLAAPMAERVGPRIAVRADPSIAPGAAEIREETA